MIINKIVFLLALFFGVSSFVAAQDFSRDTNNVEDYYNKVRKQQGIALFDASWNETSKIVTKDAKNGYLKLEGPIDGYVEVALFRKNDRRPVLVIGVTGCGPACSSDLYAFEFKNGKIVEVTKRLIPKLDEDEELAKVRRDTKDPKAEIIGYVFHLPRKGTTIKTENEETGSYIFDLEWKNDHFAIKRNVLEYYYIFPGSALNPKTKRKSEILLHDSKNGYLKLKVQTATIEAALFRRGEYPVLFVTENYCGSGRCVTVDKEVKELIGGKWIDVEREVLPSWLTEARIHAKSKFAAKNGYQYKVPRFGRTVKIVEGDGGKAIYKFSWNGRRFRLTR